MAFLSDATFTRSVAPPSDRLVGLQMLRGIAAMLVLIGHVLAEAQHYFGRDMPLMGLPWSRGVDIFFVISGFVVVLSARRYAGRPGAFLKRRALRVVPLYWLFTSLMVAVLLLAPGAAKDTALEPGQIVASYLFVPFERHDGRIAPVLSLGWTLNYEMWFYALLAMALCLKRPVTAVAAVLVTLVAVGVVLRPTGAVGVTWTNPLVLEFLMGAVLARIYETRGTRGDARLGIGLLLAGLALLVTLDGLDLPRAVAAGVPAAVIVAAGTLYWPPGIAPGQRLGDASYALYLSHRFALRPLTLLLVPLLPATPLAIALFCAVAIGSALALAFAVHAGIEAPLLARLAARRAEVRTA